MRVKATREGLLDARLAIVALQSHFLPFVALPSTFALYRFVRVHNPLLCLTTYAIVLAAGPWYQHDHEYVEKGARPLAERGRSSSGGVTDGAGIALSDAVWSALGMTEPGPVLWEFLE